MYVKRIALLIIVIASSTILGGGMPEMIINKDGVLVNRVDEEVIKQKQRRKVIKRKIVKTRGESSYQRLKTKYEAEGKYANELHDRISNLEIELEKKDCHIRKLESIKPTTKLVKVPVTKIVTKEVIKEKEAPAMWLILSAIGGLLLGIML